MIYFPFELVKTFQQERIDEAELYRQLKQIGRGETNRPDHLFSMINPISICSGWQSKKQVKQILAGFTKVEMRFEGWLRNRLSH